MPVTHMTGPLSVYGNPSGTTTGATGHAGPSSFYQGTSLLDPRQPYGPGGTTAAVSYFKSGPFLLVDQVPSTLSATNIAAAQAVGSATTLTLVSSSGSGITVTTASAVAANLTGYGRTSTNVLGITSTTTLLAIDTAYSPNTVNTVNALHDPTKAIARNVRITSAGNDSGITFAVSGFDIYGNPMNETITGANAGVASGAKAFKYIKSVTSSAAAAGNVSVGTGDVYGFPLRVDRFEQALIFWAGALITSSTGWTAADSNTATATTGDVRGTYATQSASNNSRRLVMYVMPTPAAVTSATSTDPSTLFGKTQF